MSDGARGIWREEGKRRESEQPAGDKPADEAGSAEVGNNLVARTERVE